LRGDAKEFPKARGDAEQYTDEAEPWGGVETAIEPAAAPEAEPDRDPKKQAE
jgi:hypothetical protein